MIDPANFDADRFKENAAAAARLLRALASERRLMILCQLTGGERAVGELQPLIGVSQSALSQHLAVLRSDGLVATRRDGLSIYYRIADPAAAQVMATLAAIFCPDDVETPHAQVTDPAGA
ncbi:metalloregulator ArsR/SmtB family transcription factor [Sphingomonas sp. AR_OL41]|uniref:ArsR/SmtB family transcription factor n=1 Tax=Sphingomonas sp. AR_OL41 TaxID=3042729 RepID=UPI00248023F4|nr:metalloregulator ArsR/SmtB family transcription factor [Sphingomonas sp. AR_OL41]MDH7972628.1 metalloregulator ArsR/SmtB family transcription factor [Sphingomonas sp. AR_OL41]